MEEHRGTMKYNIRYTSEYIPKLQIHQQKHLDDSIQILLLYFEDILITGSCISNIGSIKSSLHNAFSLTNLGLLKQFLGLERAI